MDVLINSFELKPGADDVAFCDAIGAYLGALAARGEIAGFRILRRKLALGIAGVGEFLVLIEAEGLAQLDRAFASVSTRSGPIEELHAAVNQQVCELRAALYRDFPDAQRLRGGEKF